jgi:hypothetical protein
MLNVDKDYCDSSYIQQYWKNNLIIDQSKTKINENRNLSLEDDIKKELDKNTEYKYNKKDNYNNKYSANIYKYSDNTNNKYSANIYKYNVEHNNSYDATQNRGYYRKQHRNREHNLSTKTRIEEYNLKDRKILLDSFSKPKLLLESSRKQRF